MNLKHRLCHTIRRNRGERKERRAKVWLEISRLKPARARSERDRPWNDCVPELNVGATGHDRENSRRQSPADRARQRGPASVTPPSSVIAIR